jgi:excisionase family DNA binding protein
MTVKYPDLKSVREQGTTVFMPEWLSTRNAADYLGVSTDVIYDAVHNLGLKHTVVGGRRIMRFRREWLDEWMEAFARMCNRSDETDRIEPLRRCSTGRGDRS